MKKITAIIMVMAIAIATVFATAGLPSTSDLNLNFTVADSSVLAYGFQHEANSQTTSFTVGSTANGGKGITASPNGGYTLSLMDNSYYHTSSAYTLYINLGTPSFWKNSAVTPVIETTSHPTINGLDVYTAADGVTATVETANAKIKVVYDAVTAAANIVKRNAIPVEIATFNVQWGAEEVPAGTYTSTVAVTFTAG